MEPRTEFLAELFDEACELALEQDRPDLVKTLIVRVDEIVSGKALAELLARVDKPEAS